MIANNRYHVLSLFCGTTDKTNYGLYSKALVGCKTTFQINHSSHMYEKENVVNFVQ